MCGIPILFVIFNRKETALKSFERIREVKPAKLYIASDGPRDGIDGESDKVEATRKAVLSAIDWECQVKTLFRDRNVGCGQGVYTAINWLFENEEYGIILEDDCVAERSFFRYAEEMLATYENDSRIGMIAGYNPVRLDGYEYSCLFSRFKSCWGWATWRRAWQNMDIDMKWRDTQYAESIIANSGYHNRDGSKWRFELKCIDNNVVSAWDWQWYFSLSAQNQLCVYPVVNQISNIGNGKDATHTSFSDVVAESYAMEFPLKCPEYIVPYERFDRLFYKKDKSLRSCLSRIIPPSIKTEIKKIINKF